ncbi:MAG: tetratricopeptide repeat protein [Chloracidobacterium sp.]|nr:tetratricopeptide repeat protein [Chloracidobacterium sp.]
MKRCPHCGREYDNTMMFCLDDGAELLYGPAVSAPGTIATGSPADEPATAILSEPPASVGGQSVGESPTQPYIHTTAAAEPHESSGEPSEKQSFSAHRAAKPLLVVAVLVVLGLGGFLGYRYFSAGSKQIESIAVMPFVNEGGNADVEYLSDGMTETLIKSLTNIPEMDVKPRSAVFRYKGKDVDPTTIGKELNVQAILNGRVTQRGDLLTLSLELVDVQKNSVLWTEQYQRRQSDIVLLQGEIAKDISARLSPRLTKSESTKVSEQATTDPTAYQAYLRGRFYLSKRTGDNINNAIEQFQIAVDRDPNYALAFVGLADCYSIAKDYAINAPSDSLSRAESFAQRAIAIDGKMAEPYATLGNVYYNRWQWADSEAAFKRAIELNPKYATAYHWYSVLLFGLGRDDEAAEMIFRAQELDPLSSIINMNVAQVYFLRNDQKAAIEICNKIIDRDPSIPGGHFAIAWSYLKSGRKQEAVAEFQKAVDLSGRNSAYLATLGAAFAFSGRTADAQGLIKELEERYAKKQAYGKDLATIYAALGDKDKAFEWLEKDFVTHVGSLADVRWTAEFEPLRDDPRTKDLLRRMNLPE